MIPVPAEAGAACVGAAFGCFAAAVDDLLLAGVAGDGLRAAGVLLAGLVCVVGRAAGLALGAGDGLLERIPPQIGRAHV